MGNLLCIFVGQVLKPAVEVVEVTVQSNEEVRVWYNLTSSAYMTHLDEFTTSGRSLMNIKNSRGARRAPWGTPDVTFTYLELFLWITTLCSLSDRWELNH